MDELEKFNYINELFDIYGSLLSDTQRKMMEQYYVYNLSLAEIAEEFDISRTAVSDALKKGIAKCNECEEKLKLLEKKKKIIDIISDDSKTASEIRDEINEVI